MAIIKNICVYCGSSSGRNPVYQDAAVQLAHLLIQYNITLVYGGASIGIMGKVADEVLRLNGRVVGVIPEALAQKEILHPNLTETYITKSMHERKMQMADLADGFIALPGGIGTLEELFEIWTWAQLGFHQKPCGLLNVAGYYDALIQFLNQAHQEAFIRQQHLNLLQVENNPEDLINRFRAYQPPPPKQWLHADET